MNAIPQPSSDFYVAGGTLDPTASSYIVRQADQELLEAVKGGQFCYILTSRQMGKSSLMVRTASSLEESGVLSIIIDLSDRDTTSTNPEQWYLAQVLDIAEQLSLHDDYTDWWRKQPKWGVVRCFTRFLTQIVLKKISQPIVIFIDEIDSTLSLPFNCDDYFAMIRALYNKRSVDPALKRLTFVLLGVASPSDLIKDTRRTPFNIGKRIQLTDFTIQEAQPLISGLARDRKLAEKILENILFFTGGHPYLTQKTCLHVTKKAKSQWNEAEASIVVEKLIEEIFLSETGQNTDDNLQFIRKRILCSESDKQLLRNYRLIRQKQTVLDNELDPVLMELKLSGLVKNNAGILVVRNVIYERVFNESWIRIALSEFGPNPIHIFYSYAQEDESLLKEIDKHLSVLKRKGHITTWYKGNISAGTEISSEVNKHLNTADIILLIISADFLASDEYYGVEMRQALARHDANNARVIPILARPVNIQGTPFSKLQALPSNGLPIRRWETQDDAFIDTANGIRKVVDELRTPMMSLPSRPLPRIPHPHKLGRRKFTLPDVALLVAAVSSGLRTIIHDNLPRESATSPPTITPGSTPGTSVIYQADLSKPDRIYNEWEGMIFSGNAGWQISNGALLSSGNSTRETIWAKASLPTANYAVEAQLQVLTLPNDRSYSGPAFGFILRGQSNNDVAGYDVEMSGSYALDTAKFSTSGFDSAQSKGWYKVNVNPHIYRAEVKGTTIRFFIDGAFIFEAIDNANLFPSNGQVGLMTSLVPVKVTSFKVTAL